MIENKREKVKVMAAFYHNRENNRLKKDGKTGEVIPLKIKYKNKTVNVIMSNRYYEKENGEKIIVFRCFYKERGFFYKLYFYTESLQWFIKFEKN
jgi:hypothetical protein